jgi:hypothetical protein
MVVMVVIAELARPKIRRFGGERGRRLRDSYSGSSRGVL